MYKSTKHKRALEIGLGVLLVSTLIGAAGCSADDSTSTPSDGTEPGGEISDVTVLLPFPPDVTYSPVYVGVEAGIFEDNGISADFDITGGSGKVVQQVLAGNVDFGVATSGAVLAGAAKDDDLRVFSCHTPGNVFSIAASDPSVTSMSDLEGKVIGISDQAGGEVPMVKAALEAEGLDESDVKLLVVGDSTPSVLDALEAHTIDAYAKGFQVIEALRSAGADLHNIMPDSVAKVPSSCMIALGSTLDDPGKKDDAIAVARGWNESALFGETNPDAAIEIVCSEAEESCQNTELTESLFVEGLKAMTSHDADYPYGLVNQEAWKQAEDIFRTAGTLKGDVDVSLLTSDGVIDEIQQAANDYDRDEIKSLAENWGS